MGMGTKTHRLLSVVLFGGMIVATPLTAAVPAAVAGAVQADKVSAVMDQIVHTDSRGWMTNTYDRGSMNNVRMEARSDDGRLHLVRGEYTYNGGYAAWVRVRFRDGQVQCMEYWDFSGACRPIRSQASSQAQAGSALFVMLMAAGMLE